MSEPFVRLWQCLTWEGQDRSLISLQNADGRGKKHFLVVLSAWAGPSQVSALGKWRTLGRRGRGKNGLIFKGIQGQIGARK